MSTPIEVAPADPRELTLGRILDAPRAAVWRAWTEPELLKQWFCPAPWTVARAELDVRPGGASLIVMQGPEGQEMPNPGVYLEVVPHERLVFTDAFTSAWRPSGKPFMVAEVTFEDAGEGRTRYVARARHWSDADRKAHEEMGFHTGWGIAADQLEAVAQRLAQTL
jgi:uncharacterized protein YndB with AHSA1/START domain